MKKYMDVGRYNVFFFSSRRRHTRCALVAGGQRVLFRSPSNLRQACSSFTIFATEPEWLPIAVSISAATARRRTIAKALAWGRGVSLKRLVPRAIVRNSGPLRSEEHTSELQSLMRISYAVFCLKKKKNNNNKSARIT